MQLDPRAHSGILKKGCSHIFFPATQIGFTEPFYLNSERLIQFIVYIFSLRF